MVWITRAKREWFVVASAVTTALLGANDALDIITWRELDRWIFFIAFVLFALIVLIRLGQLQERLDNRERFRRAYDGLYPFIEQGNAILEQCGRPAEMYSADAPMYFVDYCLPKMNEWALNMSRFVGKELPEYKHLVVNLGNVTHETNIKPASIQTVERALEGLGRIADDLQQRMWPQ